MKATNQETVQNGKPDISDATIISAKKQEKPVEQGEPLLEIKILKSKFSSHSTQIEQFQKYAEKIMVDSSTSLTVAENNVGLINDTLKNIEKVRKILKDPYMQTSKMIDEYAKILTGPLTEAKLSITQSITNYKSIETATKKAEAKQALEETEKLADAKSEEADKIFRIESQMNARIYGGHWFNKNNQQQSSSGCITAFETNDLRKMIKEKLPSPDIFIHLQKEYKILLKEINKRLTEKTTSIIESETESEIVKENATKEMETARNVAIQSSNVKKQELAQTIIKEAKKDIKVSTDAIQEAGKGVRKQLKFELDNIANIPNEWLQLDETAIRKWALANKQKIRNSIEKENGIITGIKFYFEQTYVSR